MNYKENMIRGCCVFMVYLKENIKDLFLFLDELNINNYTCFGQKKYIIGVTIGRGNKHIEELVVLVEGNDEQVKLNNYLRKRTQ